MLGLTPGIAMSKLEIETFAHKFRAAVEPCWEPGTGVYDALYPPGYEVPPSGGQCAPTSAVLWGELCAAFPGEKFKLTVGALYLGRIAVLGHHTYVTHHPIIGRTPTAVDVTPDQAPDIDDKVIFGDMQELLTTRGLAYLAFIHYDQPRDSMVEDLQGTVLERAAALRERLGDWKRRAGIP